MSVVAAVVGGGGLGRGGGVSAVPSSFFQSLHLIVCHSVILPWLLLPFPVVLGFVSSAALSAAAAVLVAAAFVVVAAAAHIKKQHGHDCM